LFASFANSPSLLKQLAVVIRTDAQLKIQNIRRKPLIKGRNSQESGSKPVFRVKRTKYRLSVAPVGLVKEELCARAAMIDAVC